MHQGEPTDNRIPEDSILQPRDISKDALLEALDKCGDSPGCKGLIKLLAHPFYSKVESHSLISFRSYIYQYLNALRSERYSTLKSFADFYESRGMVLTKDDITKVTFNLIQSVFGKEIDFDTAIYISNIIEKNNWADFESIFSQIDPVPLSSSTSPHETQSDIELPEIEEVLLNISNQIESVETADEKVTMSSLESILEKLKIPEHEMLFIYTVLVEWQEREFKAEIPLETLESAVIEKLLALKNYFNDLKSTLINRGVVIDRQIMSMILLATFKKFLPAKNRMDPRYKSLVKLINKEVYDMEYIFTRIRCQLLEDEYLNDIEPLIQRSIHSDSKKWREQ